MRMFRSSVRIEAPLYPTEDEDRVRRAMLQLFPSTDLRKEKEGKEDILVGSPPSLDLLKEKLAQQSIRDSARTHLESRANRTLTFMLGKQAATVGKINFMDTIGPLGEIQVTVEGDIPGFVGWLTEIEWKGGEERDGESCEREKGEKGLGEKEVMK